MRKNTTNFFGILIALFLIIFSNTKSNACTECGITSIGTISGPSSVCAGETATFTFSGTNCLYSGCTLERITYVYSGSTLIYQSSINTTSSQAIVLQNAGSYTVYAKVRAKNYSYWCKTNTLCFTVNAKPAAPTSSCTSISKCAGQSFTLSATPASNTTIKWYKGTTYLGSGNSITATETTVGTYTYKAYSYNSTTGCKSANSLDFTVTITSGVSGLVINAPATAFIGEAVSISGSASGTGNSFSWNFGSGATPATGTGVGPNSVTYSTIGTKTITMTVSNGNGCVSSITKTIVICPKAIISCPQSTCNNTSMSFSATDMGTSAIYSWNFGTGANPATSTGIGPHSVSYSSTGSKTVTLTVTDNTLTACTSTATKTIQINGVQNPVINALSSIVFGNTLTVSGSATGNNLSYSWNFGADASPTTGTGAGPFNISYSAKGTKTITLTVTDGANCSVSITKEVSVCDGYNIDAPTSSCVNNQVSITATKVGSTTSCGDTICWVSPTKSYVTARTYWNETSDNITIRTTFSKEFVDNTYGTNKIGWPGNHNFSDLTGSDKLQLALYDANGTKSIEFKIDYLSASSTVSSGYKSLGVLGGDGGMLVGSSSNIVSCLTSLDVNFNQYGYVLTTNSPATDANYSPNSSYPNWIYEVWYEVTVKKAAFGTAGFGYPVIASVHASPSKTGNNTEVVEKTTCPVNLSWNFGSGATPQTATGIGPHNVSYSTSGAKTITLKSGGCSTENCSNVFTKIIDVNNGTCAEINIPNFKLFMDTALTYTATQIQGATYSWSATGGATISGSGNTVTILFPAAGSQTITLVTTINGCSCTTTKGITVFEPICQGIKFDYTTVPLKTNMKNYLYIDVTGNRVKLYKPTYNSDSFHTSRKFQRNGDTAISWQELTSTTSTSSIKFNRSASDLTFTIRDLDKPSSYNNEMMEIKAYLNGDLIQSSKIEATYNSSNISKISDDGYVTKYKGLVARSNSSSSNDLKLYFVSKVDSVLLKLSNVNGNNCGYKSDVGLSKMSFCITEPLPVTWLKVKAVKNNTGSVNINWATASEINNDYFTIEKSIDKVNFEAIGKVNGSGNTSLITNYSFEDKSHTNTTAYYRIKQTDYDGKFDYSIIVAVTPDNVIDNIKINPNPASDWATINWESGMRKDITVQITNLVGVVVYNQTVPAELNSYILNLENVQNGFYIINIIHNNTIISKSKLIVKKS